MAVDEAKLEEFMGQVVEVEAVCISATSRVASPSSIMAVEPFAADRPEDNFNPVGRLFYSASTMVCVPNSLAGEGAALGAQAGE